MAQEIVLIEITSDELKKIIQEEIKKVLREFLPSKKNDDCLLSSISEVSEFLKCSRTTSQSLKNRFPHIFHQVGLRKFVVSKRDLLNAIEDKIKR